MLKLDKLIPSSCIYEHKKGCENNNKKIAQWNLSKCLTLDFKPHVVEKNECNHMNPLLIVLNWNCQLIQFKLLSFFVKYLYMVH